MNQSKCIIVMMDVFKVNQIQAMHMSDLTQRPESWTYMPSGVKRSLRPLIFDRKILKIVKEPVEGDTQIYEWLMLTDETKGRLAERMK